MSLIICKNCGAQVSDKADACPICGAPICDVVNNENLEASAVHDLSEKETEAIVAQTETTKIATMSPEEIAAQKAEEERKKKATKRKNISITVFFILLVLLAIGGIVAYRIINKPIGARLDSAYSNLLAQDYEIAKSECDKVYTGLLGLDEEQQCRLAKYYYVIGSNAKDQDATEKFSRILYQLINSQSDDVEDYLEDNFLNEVIEARLTKAYELYKDCKIGESKKLCNKINGNLESLSFAGKCKLASFYAAISKVDEDISNKMKCASLYKQVIAFNAEEANAIFAKYDVEFGTNIANIVKETEKGYKSKTVSRTTTNDTQMITNDIVRSVVVTGTSVRLRLAPNLKSNTLTDSYGKNVHPDKGEHLKYIGETAEFYRVEYKGHNVWISKQFTVPSSDEVR